MTEGEVLTFTFKGYHINGGLIVYNLLPFLFMVRAGRRHLYNLGLCCGTLIMTDMFSLKWLTVHYQTVAEATGSRDKPLIWSRLQSKKVLFFLLQVYFTVLVHILKRNLLINPGRRCADPLASQVNVSDAWTPPPPLVSALAAELHLRVTWWALYGRRRCG